MAVKGKQFFSCLSVAAVCACLTACQKPIDATALTTAEITTVTSLTTTTTTTTTTVATTTTTKKPTTTTAQPMVLDPNYSRLLLVNEANPISADFNKSGDLVSVDKQYINGSLNQVDKGMYPYLMALLQAAKADGVALYVRSPYRSYSTQKMLFQNKVNRVINGGTPAEEAEAVAARAVARPGTSEHQTGLAVDFNIADSQFESMPAFGWMKEHAEDYGFILRYPKDKTEVTGIMYESWHWRFVGINTAKEMNRLGLTLEEYVAQNNQ